MEERGHPLHPWPASEENIVLLGEAIDLELKVQGQGQSVGPFEAAGAPTPEKEYEGWKARKD